MSDENTNENTSENTNEKTLSFDWQKWLAEENARKDENKTILKKFVVAMKEAGATGTIEVSYDGYGDSGDVTEPDLTDKQAEIAEKLGYQFSYSGETRIYDSATGESITTNKDEFVPLLTIISDVIPHDWVNNDGGFGVVYLNLDDATVLIDGNIRIQSTESVEESF